MAMEEKTDTEVTVNIEGAEDLNVTLTELAAAETAPKEEKGKLNFGAVALGVTVIGGIAYGAKKAWDWNKERKAKKKEKGEALDAEFEEVDIEEEDIVEEKKPQPKKRKTSKKKTEETVEESTETETE